MANEENEWSDPIVDEIHRIREEMAKEAGGDVFELIRRLNESREERLQQLASASEQQETDISSEEVGGEDEEPWEDPIVEEIHRIRQEMLEEVGCDFDEFARQLMESQKRHGDKLVYLGKHQQKKPPF